MNRAARVGGCSGLIASLALLASAAPQPARAGSPLQLERAHAAAPLDAKPLASGEVLLEVGAGYRRATADVGFAPEQSNLGAAAARLGLPAGFELQAGFDGYQRRTRERYTSRGTTDFQALLKLGLGPDAAGLRSALVAGVRVPSGAHDMRARWAQVRGGLLWSKPLARHLMLHVNGLLENSSRPQGRFPAVGDLGPRIVVERFVGAVELVGASAYGGYFEVYYREDTDIAYTQHMGVIGAVRWGGGRRQALELVMGLGRSNEGTKPGVEWLVGFGAGATCALWGSGRAE